MLVKDIKAREILDSRSNPTVEVEMILENGIKCTASVPSGASTGSKEALELRDNDEKRFHGKGVLKAVNNINNIIKPEIVGMNLNQKKIDKLLLELDGTENKSNLGANAILAVSLVTLKCLAANKKQELYKYTCEDKPKMPSIMVNVINGGVHADNNLDIQEFMIVPTMRKMKDKVRCASEIFTMLKKILKDDGYSTGVGDEGGFAPNFKNNEEAFKYLEKASILSGYKPGKDVNFAIDVAASELYDKEKGIYVLDKKRYTTKKLIEYYYNLCNKYPIISIEDPFDENDDAGFIEFTKLAKCMVVGDDYFVTQKKYLQKGIENKACNTILLKANQVGTITEFLETIELARKSRYYMIISHRSGETEDTFISDLAVGLNIPYIKTGSICRGERIAKYNRLMKIEDEIK